MTLTTVDFDACWLCRRPDDGAGVLVSVEGRIRWMCSYCVDREDVETPLDNTERDTDAD